MHRPLWQDILIVVLALAVVGSAAYLILHENAPAIPQSENVRVIMAGRMNESSLVGGDRPAGAIILYIEPGTSEEDFVAEMGALDGLALSLIREGDSYVYYFDTLDNGTVWYGMRCSVDSYDIPFGDRICEFSKFNRQIPLDEFVIGIAFTEGY